MVTFWPTGSWIVIPESASVRMLLPVTGGPGGELRIVGKAVIGGAMTGVTVPPAVGKADVVAGLADADESGDPPGAALVPQAARPTVARLAAIITVKACARVVRRMLVGRPAASQGFRSRPARPGRES